MEHVATGLRAQLLLLWLCHHADTVRYTVKEIWRQIFPGDRYAHQLGVRIFGPVVRPLWYFLVDHHTVHPGTGRSELHVVVQLLLYR